MTREFDPRKSYLTVKANEKMLAFVGFVIQLKESGESKEGVVKISSFHRPYGGGYLTLTFIVDRGDDEELVNQLSRVLGGLTENSLRTYLGNEFEKMVKVSLNTLEEVKGWYIEEINMHYRSVGGREKLLVEDKLIPALEGILPCTFDTVEWWPAERNLETAVAREVEEPISLRALFKKWFGVG